MTSTLPAFNIIRSETEPEADPAGITPEIAGEEEDTSTLKPDSNAPSTGSFLGDFTQTIF